MSETNFKGALAACWLQQWTRTESTSLVTEVHWPFGTLSGITRTVERQSTSSASEVLALDNFDGLECSIFLERPLEPLEIPFGVAVSSVILKQLTYFEKGSFALSLTRQWTGANNVEAEASALNEKPTCFATIDIVDPETVLQNRCTDAQLANAVVARIPKA